MELTGTLIIVAVLIVAIWVIIEMKRLKHKIFAIFLILLILFSYLSFSFLIKGEDIDLKTIGGVTKVGKIYFSWLFSIGHNLKEATSNAIKMDWKLNKSFEE